MNEFSDLTIIVPCYNETDNIDRMFPALIKFCCQRQYIVIVVNDGSKDNSKELLCKYESAYVKIISHKLNRGYGAALKTGLMAATTTWAITIDADGQHQLKDVDRLLACAKATDADLVVGGRNIAASGLFRQLGKLIIRSFSSLLLKIPVRDLNSGMKLYRLDEARPYFNLCPDTMAFSDVILLLMANDRRLIVEEKIEINPRVAGTSTIGVHTAMDTMNEILNISMLICPQKIFTFIGIVLFISGISWGAFTYYKSYTITTAAALFLFAAGISFSIGLLGEQLARIRREINRRKD